MTRKRWLIILACCVFALAFTSCSGGIDKEEAKVFIGDFFEAIVAGDYEKAETFLHPERPAELEPFFEEVEDETGIDFQAGIEISKYTGFSSTYYDSTVDGSTYELTMQTKVGDEAVKFTIEIVQNEEGYGIYNLDLDADI